MPKMSKAARGKHRWIGLVFDETFLEINSLRKTIQNLIQKPHIKLFDYINEDKRKSCIIKIELGAYGVAKEKLRKKDSNIFSITSSGKIRLVRLRLEEYFQRQVDD